MALLSLFPPLSWAQDHNPGPLLKAVSRALDFTPHNQRALVRLLQHPHFPQPIKAMVTHTLLDPNLLVLPMSAVPRHYHIRSDCIGFLIEYPLPFRFLEGTAEKVIMGESSDNLSLWPHTTPKAIYLTDKPLNFTSNQSVLTLVHELAHVHFNSQVLNGGPHWSQLFPELVKVDHSGALIIHYQLFTLLTEFYAHVFEYNLARYMDTTGFHMINSFRGSVSLGYAHAFPHWLKRFWGLHTPQLVIHKILDYVASAYGIDQSLVEVVKGKTWDQLAPAPLLPIGDLVAPH